MPKLTVLNGPIIAAGESVSAIVECTCGLPVRITMPAQWTSANQTFQISTEGLYYNDLFDKDGDEILIAVVPGAGMTIPEEYGRVFAFMKFRSGTAKNPVVQETQRDFSVALLVHESAATEPPPPERPEMETMPACSVYQTQPQEIVQGVPTKIMFDTAEYDTTSAFDLVNSKFQPKVAGYYQISHGSGVQATWVFNYASLYKNGEEFRRATTAQNSNTRLSTLVHLDGVDDYVEGYIYSEQAGSTAGNGIISSFSAVLVQPEN